MHRSHTHYSLGYAFRRRCDQVVKDLTPTYTATDVDSALQALEAFDPKWGKQLPIVTKARRESGST